MSAKGSTASSRTPRGQEDVPMLSSLLLRRAGLGAIVISAFALSAIPGQAQMRQQMADKVATSAGNAFVSKIDGESCADFAKTMSQMKGKSGGSGGSSSSMSQKLNSNTEARTAFVNIVAAPLLNKMISCNMLPGGM
jgi:hypothetical protein